jgi:hypothetical protein
MCLTAAARPFKDINSQGVAEDCRGVCVGWTVLSFKGPKGFKAYRKRLPGLRIPQRTVVVAVRDPNVAIDPTFDWAEDISPDTCIRIFAADRDLALSSWEPGECYFRVDLFTLQRPSPLSGPKGESCMMLTRRPASPARNSLRGGEGPALPARPRGVLRHMPGRHGGSLLPGLPRGRVVPLPGMRARVTQVPQMRPRDQGRHGHRRAQVGTRGALPGGRRSQAAVRAERTKPCQA